MICNDLNLGIWHIAAKDFNKIHVVVKWLKTSPLQVCHPKPLLCCFLNLIGTKRAGLDTTQLGMAFFLMLIIYLKDGSVKMIV